jgi:hypothetical protein
VASAAPSPAAPATCVEGDREAAAEVGKTSAVINAVTALTKDENDAAIITLRYAPEARCAWAWIGGQPGATVWIDRERVVPGGANTTELELGSRSIKNGNGSTYGGAYRLGGDTTRIRACGQVREAPTCGRCCFAKCRHRSVGGQERFR